MARHPRCIFPGVALHVRQRGVDGMACFRVDGDYLLYLTHLRHVAAKYECELHAYCLMTNHVHLLLTPPAPDACGLMIRDLGCSYVRYFNGRHGRTGTLWEGRYRACLVESPAYVLGCYRYIENNPAHARMVDHPRDYRWSSYAANTGMREETMVKPHCEYLALSEHLVARQAAYRGLFETPLNEGVIKAIRDATYGGYALVSDAFKSRFGVKTERRKPGPRAEMPQGVYELEAT